MDVNASDFLRENFLKEKPVSQFETIVEETKNMTSDEFRKTLMDAGITDSNGVLMPQYKARPL
jgi:hypothetical protein